jgi:hypothetical protein
MIQLVESHDCMKKYLNQLLNISMLRQTEEHTMESGVEEINISQ